MKEITIAGSMLVDYVKSIDVYAKKGMLCNVLDISKNVGGCVPNTLCDLAALDGTIPLKCIGIVGNDEDGRFLKEELQKRNADISDVVTKENTFTSFTDVMTEDSTGERTFFHARGANKELDETCIPYERLNPGILHMGYALLLDALDKEDETYGTHMARVLKNAQDAGIATSMDVASEDSERFAKIIKPSLKYLDYFIVNEIEAGKTTGLKVRTDADTLDKGKIEEACRRILDYGVSTWVVIHAPESAFAMNKKGEFFECASLDLPKEYIKGSVGAGDAFCAGMLLSLYYEYPMPEALKIANAAAACNLSSVDSTSGMGTKDEALNLIKRYGFRKENEKC